MHNERSELARYRLEADLSYDQLALRVGKSRSWVHQFLTAPKPTATERTLFQIRTFLDSARNNKSKKGAAA